MKEKLSPIKPDFEQAMFSALPDNFSKTQICNLCIYYAYGGMYDELDSFLTVSTTMRYVYVLEYTEYSWQYIKKISPVSEKQQ